MISIRYASPLQVIVELIPHGAVLVSPVAIAATILKIVKMWNTARVETAEASKEVARHRAYGGAYDLLVSTLSREIDAPGAMPIATERIHDAANALQAIEAVRQIGD